MANLGGIEMERKVYVVPSQTEPFKVWKTYNTHQREHERNKDIKNNYPMICPRPAKGETRLDCITEKGYMYGMKDLKGTADAVIVVGHEGIKKIFSLTNGFLSIKNF